MFQVQRRQCATCIYRRDSTLDIIELESQVRDERGDFCNFRICHHSTMACCRGFWNRHRNEFQLGQVAQRLGLVEFVDHDTMGK